MANIKRQSILKIFSLIFLLFYPLVGLVFFHNKFVTLLCSILILFIFVFTLCFFPNSRKNSKYIFLYLGCCLIYLLLSYYHQQSFKSLIPSSFNIIREGLTILKIILPVIFCYSLHFQKITLTEYNFILKSWLVFIAGSIIFTNIFKISLNSYSNSLIKYNIFEWRKGLYYLFTASKGYFTYANQVSTILLIIIPILFYKMLYENKNYFYYFIINCLALLMLGTRVSSIGGLLVIIILLLFYWLDILVKKEKINKFSLIVLPVIIIWCIILPSSPCYNRYLELNHKLILPEIKNFQEEKENLFEDNNLSPKYLYVINHYDKNYLPNFFFKKNYPISYDEDFWYRFVKNHNMNDINYRLIEESIIKRMWEINNNKMDILLGISNDRIQHVVNLERDFRLHFYAFGIIGWIILLLFYLFLLITAFYKIFQKPIPINYVFLAIIILFIFSSYLSGNIINSIFPTLCFSFLLMFKTISI